MLRTYSEQMKHGGLSVEWNDLLFALESRLGVDCTEATYWDTKDITVGDVVSFAQDQLQLDSRPQVLELAISTAADEDSRDILDLLSTIASPTRNTKRAVNRLGIAILSALMDAEGRGEIAEFENVPSDIAFFWEDFCRDAYLPNELSEVSFWYGAFDWQGWLDITKQWLCVAIQKFGGSLESNR